MFYLRSARDLYAGILNTCRLASNSLDWSSLRPCIDLLRTHSQWLRSLHLLDVPTSMHRVHGSCLSNVTEAPAQCKQRCTAKEIKRLVKDQSSLSRLPYLVSKCPASKQGEVHGHCQCHLIEYTHFEVLLRIGLIEYQHFRLLLSIAAHPSYRIPAS